MTHWQVLKTARTGDRAGARTRMWRVKLGVTRGVLSALTGTGGAAAAPHENERRAGQADHPPHDDADCQVVAPPPPSCAEWVKQEDAPLRADTHLEKKNIVT